MLAYEPILDGPPADGVRLLGIEATRRTGSWPTMRHVFDLEWDAGLHVEVDPLCGVTVYAVGFNASGDEMLTPL